MPYFAVQPVPLGTKSQAAVAHTHAHTHTWTRLASTHRKQLLAVTCVVLIAEPACEEGPAELSVMTGAGRPSSRLPTVATTM